MKIKMLHNKGNLKKGKIYDFNEKKTTELLTGGHCVRVWDKPADKPETPAETSKRKNK